MNDKSFLKNVKLFADLTNEELTIIGKSLKIVHYKANEVIFEEDSSGNELFLLFEGQVCISKKTSFIDNQSNINKTLINLNSKDYPFLVKWAC